MRICLMIEGQEGVSWEEWVALAQACDEHGLEGLFRSDHYGSTVAGEARGSLDAWATLAALAPLTTRIRLGTLVSPATFRHPAVLAKSALAVDHASGGRVEIGMGAGWMEEEHRAFGIPFLDGSARLGLLTEQLEVVHRLLTGETAPFAGEHYSLDGTASGPAPVQRPRPPIIVGGAGRSGTVRPAVRFADEYNTTFPTVDECGERRRRLDDACRRAGRDPASLPLSVMTGAMIGRDRAEVQERVRRRAERAGSRETAEEYAERRGGSFVIGTVEEAAERLREYEAAGVERVMLQHLDHIDLDMVELIGRGLVPALA